MCSEILKRYLVCACMAALSLCAFAVSADGTENPEQGGPKTVIKTLRKQYTIFFRINRWDIDTTFRGNGGTIRRMQAEIDSLISEGSITADSISIVSAASPDGGNAFNVWLSKKRGLSTMDLLEERYPDIDPEIIYIDPMGEDWSTFRKVVYEDRNIPARDELIALMESDLTNDEKEKVLRKMNPAFRYILKHHIYLMRASAVTFNVSVPMVLMPPIAGPQALAEGPEGNILYRQVQPLPQAPVEKKMILAARTNLLVPALNVGVEVPVGYSWSVGADYYFPWWLARSNRYCAEMLGWFVDQAAPESCAKAAREQGMNLHTYLTGKAEQLKPGQSGLAALDWWNGNKTPFVDGRLSGVLAGCTLGTKPEEIYRALIEATAFGTRRIVDLYEEAGAQIEEIIASGGIAEKNPLFLQIYADVLGKRIRVSATEQTAAVGSAVYASVAAGAAGGGYETLQEAVERMSRIHEKAYEPDPENQKTYQELYELYKELSGLFDPGKNTVLAKLLEIKSR